MPEPNALHTAQQAAGAVFATRGNLLLAEHFGDPAAEYEALTTAAGLVDLSERTRIELTGEDRAKFLHNLCTNEVRKLPPGAGCEAFLCDARGHVLFHVFIICRPESLIVETMPGEGTRLLAHLDRYLIREQVALADRAPDTCELLVAGPLAAATIGKLAASVLPTERLGNDAVELAGCNAIVVQTDWIGVDGFLLIGDRAEGAKLWQSLYAAGARPCGAEALEIARNEAGFPWYGVDISDKNLPQEVARDAQAISFVKGCYLGQETVARIDALGHVNKSLAGVKFLGKDIPQPGAELKVSEQTVGEVTSACFSPRFNTPLALAYLRRGHNQPGVKLESAYGAAEVVKLPGLSLAL
ncbi:MAG TPA: glycine cleavage T C-terminal barrel domain-containing protein [Pirellulales bacterium]|nr:glycine cleavage T C-terminal barrel domain-containing protein [Pirellulales bacterium]